MKKIVFIVFITISQLGQAQNLVLNSSFEDENICEFHQACSPSAWFYINRSTVAGYFKNEVPGATGKRWLSIAAGNRLNTGGRQYWQTMLVQKLVKGKTYKIAISIHGWDVGPNASDIGINFIPVMKYYSGDTLLQPPVYLDFVNAKTNGLKNGWVRLEKEYVANDEVQFMMVGNFSPANYREVAKKRDSKSNYIGLLIDDIEIIPVDKMNCESCMLVKDSLYAVNERHSIKNTVVDNDKPIIHNETEKTADTLTLNDIYFPFSSYKISNPDKFAKYRASFEKSNIEKIKIIGYTDDIGTSEGNRKLSFQRAQEVAALISADFNISSSLIEVEGRGISKDSTDKGKNRRVEIYIFHY
ncbi:MAG: OmpA family protein [Chitinophagaceae bacterium]